MLRGLKAHHLAILLIALSGCGKSDVGTQPSVNPSDRESVPSVASADPNTVAQTQEVTKTVHDFLESLRTGNEEEATRLLSTAARENTAKVNRPLTPPASDTATFKIGKVEFINNDGARVSCIWTDMDEDHKQCSDEAIWVLRKESAGWRVAGVAAQVFPDEPPVLLNFEDPEEMTRKQQMVREERRRRMESSVELRAETDQNTEKPVRR